MRFRIKTPLNKDYAGETFGIRFLDGSATVDGAPEHETRYGVPYRALPRLFEELGRRTAKVDGVVSVIQEGYVVEMLEPAPVDNPPAPPPPAELPKRK